MARGRKRGRPAAPKAASAAPKKPPKAAPPAVGRGGGAAAAASTTGSGRSQSAAPATARGGQANRKNPPTPTATCAFCHKVMARQADDRWSCDCATGRVLGPLSPERVKAQQLRAQRPSTASEVTVRRSGRSSSAAPSSAATAAATAQPAAPVDVEESEEEEASLEDSEAAVETSGIPPPKRPRTGETGGATGAAASGSAGGGRAECWGGAASDADIRSLAAILNSRKPHVAQADAVALSVKLVSAHVMLGEGAALPADAEAVDPISASVTGKLDALKA